MIDMYYDGNTVTGIQECFGSLILLLVSNPVSGVAELAPISLVVQPY